MAEPPHAEAAPSRAPRTGSGDAGQRPRTLRVSGWYAAGVGVQLLLWLLVFLGLALAVLGDNVLTEFRYVGF